MTHILIVEDDETILNILREYVEAAGFRVSCLDRGDDVISFVRKNAPDMILLDILLPGRNGTEICRGIRAFSTVPIIFITARFGDGGRVSGIELRADDYICKPFSPREVVARIKAILLRTAPGRQGQILKVGELELHEDTRRLMVRRQELRLTPIEYGLILLMMMRPDRIFTRRELVKRVQGCEFDGRNRTIDTHIKNLRRKIADVLPHEEVIHSVYGVGYRISGPRSSAPWLRGYQEAMAGPGHHARTWGMSPRGRNRSYEEQTVHRAASLRKETIS